VKEALFEIVVPGASPLHRGKVRSVYAAGQHLLLVASDRLSAYDAVLPTPIPDKGRVLTQLSAFWFRRLAAARPHHCLSTALADFPEPFRSLDSLDGRSMLCRRAAPIPVECVVRGHLAGSATREYRARGTLHGEPLPAGLGEGSPLSPARFTPTTKAQTGHDEPLTREEFRALLGETLARELEERSLALFTEASPICRAAGLVLADAKFEFGHAGGEVVLIDECLSPDASRFWDGAAFDEGRLESFDKQFVRDFLDASGWNHEPPAPALPAAVVAATRERYVEAARRLLGEGGLALAGLAELEAR
jgi:phosphoribosylaminoimidazole-succinocarboxamide synthase